MQRGFIIMQKKCIKKCVLDYNNVCKGCDRTIDEIKKAYEDARKKSLKKDVAD